MVNCTYFLKIADSDSPLRCAARGPFIFEKEICKDEYRRYKKLWEQSGGSEIPFWQAMATTARTDSPENCMSDCLFPITCNFIKVENSALEAIAQVGTALVDIATLLLRCITFVPTAFCNSQQPAHPLKKALREDQTINEKYFATGQTIVTLLKRKEKRVISQGWDQGFITVDEKWETRRINWINMPGSPEMVLRLSKSYYINGEQ